MRLTCETKMQCVRSQGGLSIHLSDNDGLPICRSANGRTRWASLDLSSSLDLKTACEQTKSYPCLRCLKYSSDIISCKEPNVSTQPGYVYLAWATETPRYKIGYSVNLEKRLRDLNSGQAPYPIQIIYSFYTIDMARDEEKLHKAFKAYRVYGEWFELPLEAVELIKCIKEGLTNSLTL